MPWNAKYSPIATNNSNLAARQPVAARQPIRSHIALTRPHCHPGRGSLLQSRIGTPYKALLKGLMFLHTKPLSPDQSGWPIFRYIFSMHCKGLTSILINVNVHAQPTHYKDPRKRATCIFFKIVFFTKIPLEPPVRRKVGRPAPV